MTIERGITDDVSKHECYQCELFERDCRGYDTCPFKIEGSDFNGD